MFNIARKTAIYMLIAMLVHYLERLIDFWREAGGLVAGNQKMLAEIAWHLMGSSRETARCCRGCRAA